ncbi:MAG: hypothetical protein JXD23_17140 [Spirochaetales bacterium]|nr:hypothetical protein [Spirochaetales bacterium]
MWFVNNMLKSRTFWAAFAAIVLGVGTWIIWLPKTLESWIALGSFLAVVFGWWTGVNKKGDAIEAKVEIAKLQSSGQSMAGTPPGDGK